MKNMIFYGNAIALNYAVPADGAPLTVQLSLFGEFVLHDGDKCVFLGKDGEDGAKIITAYVSKTKAAVFSRRVALENEEM